VHTTIGRVVIVGAGHGGFTAAAALRSAGFDGDIVLLGDEPGLPYERPPLSKDYLLGEKSVESLQFRNAAFYETSKIDYRPSTAVAELDRASGEVVLDDGERIGYDRLILAMGARNRPLPTPGGDAPGVYGIRSIADIDLVREKLAGVTDVGVIGGGFIGLEFSAAARALGKTVKLYEFQPRLLQRALPEIVSDYLRDYHERRGVEFVFSDVVTNIEQSGARLILHAADGATEVDLVVYGVGVLANDALAARAELETDNGVIVDAGMRTSDERIFAIGDCARIRVDGVDLPTIQSVQNAADQARHAAETICGSEAAYSAVPWFWSDQGAIKLQIAGLPGTAGELYVRGAMESGKFSIATVDGDRLLCVHSIGSAADHVKARRALGSAVAPTTADLEAMGYEPLVRATV
jgi:3-phenylpropionate/trans-cinnamate dioxygenase ferredoxin reductase subunit